MKATMSWWMLAVVAVLLSGVAYSAEEVKSPATKPAVAGPVSGPVRAPGAPPQGFQFPAAMGQATNVSPEMLRRVMESRSRMDELNRKIIARRDELYAENAEIKKLQTQMRETQTRIDEIVVSDAELKVLREKLEAVYKAPPPAPKGAQPAVNKVAGAAATPADAAKKPGANTESKEDGK